MTKSLCESRPLKVIEATSTSTAGTIPVVLIDAGWGSSGYYSETVLKNAANAGVFGEGLQMYLDHPGESESYDRPERSVRDLVAVLATGGTYDESAKAVIGEARPMGANAVMLEDKEFLKAIGLSIRAFGDATIGEAEGRKGQIITELSEAISVDFVTKAGRGGRVLVDLMESARPEQVNERAVQHGVTEATANETRTSLQDALNAQYGGEKSWVWVRDFDETTVWFQYETPDGSGTYELSYEQDSNGSATLGDSPVEVRAQTKYVPINAASEAATKLPAPAGQSTATESEETNMAHVQIEESRLATLESAAERVQTLESENASMRRESAHRDARDTARTVIAEEAETAGTSFSALETEGLLARVTLGTDNTFDSSAFRESVKGAAKAKADEATAASTSSTGLSGFGLSLESNGADAVAVIQAAESAAAGAFGRKIGA